ncbi:MAG: hypothetical protein N3F03_07175 [Ignavibacteria bacterium]|nr:hypothetical protein [Ignavibacteria bacterium]
MPTQKCIWMEVGYVEYKLCDRNFDCENCPFDKAIKQEKSTYQIEEITSKNSNNRNLVFTLNHIWLDVKDNYVALGLDDFAQKLIDKNCTISFPEIGTKLFKGKTFLWFIGSFGAIGFYSPLDGVVVWINQSLKNKPILFFEQNPLDIELIKVKCESELKIDLISDYESLKNRDNQILREYLLKKFSYPNMPNTLPDGGEIIKNYLSELNSQEYYQLLKLLFNKKI